MLKGESAKAFIAVGLVLVAAVTAVVLLSEKRYNWNENYEENRLYPYGSSLFKGLLEHHAGDDARFIETDENTNLAFDSLGFDGDATYVYIGREYYATGPEVESLFAFVNQGNTAFIASHTFNYRLLNACFLDVDGTNFIAPEDEEKDDMYAWGDPEGVVLSRVNDTTAHLHLYDEADTRLKITNLWAQKPVNKVWHHFNSEIELNRGSDLSIYGELEDHGPNFIGFQHGKGHIYLHCNPLAFSNHVLRTDSGFTYAAAAMNGIINEHIVWDGYNRDFRYKESEYSPPRNRHEEGFLRFILDEPALRNAWYLLVFMALAYLIFGAKRVQKPIPVIHPQRNTSIDFAETMGAMYRMEGQHEKLSDLKMRLFKAYIRDKYAMRTKDANENLNVFIAKLSERSHVEPQIIRDIFEIYHIIEGINDPGGYRLIRLHNAIEKFHAHAR